MTDGRDALREPLEAVTGERIAALEAVEGPRCGVGRKPERVGREGDASPSREAEWAPGPEMENAHASKGLDRDLGL